MKKPNAIRRSYRKVTVDPKPWEVFSEPALNREYHLTHIRALGVVVDEFDLTIDLSGIDLDATRGFEDYGKIHKLRNLLEYFTAHDYNRTDETQFVFTLSPNRIR